MNSGAPNSFGFQQSAFQDEIASFVDFIGGAEIDKAIRKVARKLAAISPKARSLFGERFYFHQQWLRFIEPPHPFQLDTSNLFAVRAASLIAGVNRIRAVVSDQGARHLRGMVLDNLSPDRDVRQIEHEIRCFTHLKRLGLAVDFADLDGNTPGRKFDLLVGTKPYELEVECKTVTGDAGSQIKSELSIGLLEAFRKSVGGKRPVTKSGFYVFKFLRPVTECRNVANQLTSFLNSDRLAPLPFDGPGFSIDFVPKPAWQEALDAGRINELREAVYADLGEDPRCATLIGEHIVGIVFQPHKPAELVTNVVNVIKEASKQCSRTRPCMIWVHFVGMQQKEFREIAEFSSNGSGGGLNAAVSAALYANVGKTGRAHVERVRFSADTDELATHPVLGSDLLLTRAVSVSGLTYDVPNPHCRFLFAEKL